MTAAEQQISGNPAAMENAQARTTVTDQAKVQDIISRMDRAHETPMFHRIVTLVAAGMLMDSIDVYIGSAVASSTLATRWSTVAQNSTFMSAGFLGLLVGSLLAGFVGDLKGRRVAYQINLLLFGGFTFLGAFAPNMAVLSLCRLGAGLGLGAEIVTGFAMVNEFAPMNRRGHWCAIVSLVANCGVPIAMLLCAWIIPRWSWRPLFVAIGLVAAIIWWLRRDIPESPRWLAVRGRYDEPTPSSSSLRPTVPNRSTQPPRPTPATPATPEAVRSASACLWLWLLWPPRTCAPTPSLLGFRRFWSSVVLTCPARCSPPR